MIMILIIHHNCSGINKHKKQKCLMQLAVGVRRGLLEDMIKFSKRRNQVDKGKGVQNYENMGYLGDYEMLE